MNILDAIYDSPQIDIQQKELAQVYPVFGPKLLQNPGGWTPMGWGPTAILGSKLARPDLPCVCVTGDGGFAMVCQEVLTAVEWDTPVVWIVFNDMALNAIRHGQRGAYDSRIIGTEFTTRADFAAMARSFSAEGITITRHEEIAGAVAHALSCGKPCVIDMHINPDPVPPPTAGGWCEPERALQLMRSIEPPPPSQFLPDLGASFSLSVVSWQIIARGAK